MACLRASAADPRGRQSGPGCSRVHGNAGCGLAKTPTRNDLKSAWPFGFPSAIRDGCLHRLRANREHPCRRDSPMVTASLIRGSTGHNLNPCGFDPPAPARPLIGLTRSQRGGHATFILIGGEHHCQPHAISSGVTQVHQLPVADLVHNGVRRTRASTNCQESITAFPKPPDLPYSTTRVRLGISAHHYRHRSRVGTSADQSAQQQAFQQGDCSIHPFHLVF